MSRYKPYPKYKESGVEWLGAVPKHWRIFQLKHAVNGCTNGVWGSEPDGNNDIVVLRVADFVRDNYSLKTDKLTIRAIRLNERQNRLLKRRDLLLEKSGGGEKQLVGMVVSFDLDIEAVTSNFVAKMTPLRDFHYRFLTYAFSHLYARRVNFMSIKQNTGIQNLDSNQYLSEYFCFPSTEEQTAIANFLDRETAKIDTLIEKQQKLIELLKEKRQALISHAVTKGLDPNVKMKDSGVEWLGEVPEHWDATKLGFLCSKIGSGKTPRGGSEVYVDQGVLFIRSQNVYDDGLRLDDVVYISEQVNIEMEHTQVKPGDILLNVTGASIGRTTIIPDAFQKANVNQHVCIIRTSSSNIRLFLAEYMKSSIAKAQIDAIQNGAAREGLNFEQISNFIILIPPLNEQKEITKHLIDKTIKIDTLIEKANQAITLLKERRTALISAAVTGKIDVRGESQCELNIR